MGARPAYSKDLFDQHFSLEVNLTGNKHQDTVGFFQQASSRKMIILAGEQNLETILKLKHISKEKGFLPPKLLLGYKSKQLIAEQASKQDVLKMLQAEANKGTQFLMFVYFGPTTQQSTIRLKKVSDAEDNNLSFKEIIEKWNERTVSQAQLRVRQQLVILLDCYNSHLWVSSAETLPLELRKNVFFQVVIQASASIQGKYQSLINNLYELNVKGESTNIQKKLTFGFVLYASVKSGLTFIEYNQPTVINKTVEIPSQGFVLHDQATLGYRVNGQWVGPLLVRQSEVMIKMYLPKDGTLEQKQDLVRAINLDSSQQTTYLKTKDGYKIL